MTQEQVVAAVRKVVAASSVRLAAQRLGVSPTYVQMVCAEDMPPGPKILRGLGLVREVRYVPRKEA